MKGIIYVVLGGCMLITIAIGLWPVVLGGALIGAGIEAVRMASQGTKK